MRKLIGLLLALMVISVAPVSAAGTINWKADSAPVGYVHEDSATIAKHDRISMSGPLAYLDDSGNVDQLDAEINSSEPAPVGVRLDKVNASAYTEFPRKDGESGNEFSWTNTTEWATASGASSAAAVSASSPAGDVSAVSFDFDVVAGETASATFSNFSITTDATKRVPIVGANVDAVAGNAEVRFEDADGDYVSYWISPSSGNDSDAGVLAMGVGNAYVEQERLADLSVEGSGDGSLSEIQSVKVIASEGNADLELFWLDTESKSEKTLGNVYADHDNDSSTDKTWKEIADKDFAGEIRLSDLSDLGSAFDNSVVYDKKVYDLRYTLEYAEESSISYEDAEDYPSFAKTLSAEFRIDVENPIDVSHGTLSLRFYQNLPSERYESVEYAIGVDAENTDLGNASYTDGTSSFNNKGEEISLSSVSIGDTVDVSLELLLTQEDADALMSSPSASGGPMESGNGGILGFFLSLPGMILAGVASVIGAAKIFGSGK